ncbi:hypothetical protein C8T65DRAFT_643052 [Cerioporus squamosus]|nr:hypothetical protein C8T65DRAFT_643052 [Cerioporus squamosus]
MHTKSPTGDVRRSSSSSGPCHAGPRSENMLSRRRQRRPDIWKWYTVPRRAEKRRTSSRFATISRRRGGHCGPARRASGSAYQLKETMSVDRAGHSSTRSRAGTQDEESRRYRIDGKDSEGVGIEGVSARARLGLSAVESKLHSSTMRR